MVRSLACLGTAIVLSACTASSPLPATPAPNVVSPAPDPVVTYAFNGECVVGTIRADRVTGPNLVDLLGAHVPTWLPTGFGLMIGWTVEGGAVGERSDGGIWTDERCRQVRLEVFPGAAGEESPRPDGRWVLEEAPYNCVFHSRHLICRLYHAQSDGDALSLQTVGLSQHESARVVDGIGV